MVDSRVSSSCYGHWSNSIDFYISVNNLILMRGIVVTQLHFIIAAIIFAVVLTGSLLFIYRVDIQRALRGGGICGDGACDPGETATSCPDDCAEVSANLTFEHLVINSSWRENFDSGTMTEWIKFPILDLPYEDCTDCTVCSECEDTQYFNTSVADCFDCDGCDSGIGMCEFCENCTSAKSDYYLDDTTYDSCTACYTCSSCLINEGEILSDSCSNCEWCELCNNTAEQFVNYDNCDYCSSGSASEYQGCMGCYKGTKPEEEIRFFNWCGKCNSCANKGTAEPWICERIADCVANYGYYAPGGCPVDLDMPVVVKSGETLGGVELDLADKIKAIVASCKPINFMRELVEGGRQFVCRLAPADFGLTKHESSTYDEEGLTFNDCGGSAEFGKVHINRDTLFSQAGGFHAKIVIGNASFNIGGTNKCDFNIYLCLQPNITADYEDPILDIYKDFALFNISTTTIPRVVKYYTMTKCKNQGADGGCDRCDGWNQVTKCCQATQYFGITGNITKLYVEAGPGGYGGSTSVEIWRCVQDTCNAWDENDQNKIITTVDGIERHKIKTKVVEPNRVGNWLNARGSGGGVEVDHFYVTILTQDSTNYPSAVLYYLNYNLGTKTYSKEQIAETIVAGFKDWNFLNSMDNETLEDVKNLMGMIKKPNKIYYNYTAPWKLEAKSLNADCWHNDLDSSALIQNPTQKLIYYRAGDSYTGNIKVRFMWIADLVSTHEQAFDIVLYPIVTVCGS